MRSLDIPEGVAEGVADIRVGGWVREGGGAGFASCSLNGFRFQCRNGGRACAARGFQWLRPAGAAVGGAVFQTGTACGPSVNFQDRA